MNIKKIAFIEAGTPDFQMLGKFKMPRVGSALLATMLRDMGYQVRAFVEDIAPVDWQYVRGADLVCISTITNTAIRAYAIASRVRALGIPVVMGGVHPTYMPSEALEYADYVVRGEGERPLLSLVESLDAGSPPLSGIKGISYRDPGKKIIHTRKEDILDDIELDALPDPDFRLVHGWKPSYVYPVSTSRGCPFDCNFCSVVPMFGRKYRFKSVERTLAELRYIKSIKKGTRFFVDDNFTANKARSKILLRAIIEEGLRDCWVVQARTDVAKDPELIRLMADAGVHTIYIGFESINPKTLKKFNKKQELSDIVSSINIIRDNGMHIHGMFILGADTDDLDTIKKTADFAANSGIETVQIIALTPLPGTRLFEEIRGQGRLLHTDWSKYNLQHVVFRPQQMSPSTLQMETIKANKRFYSWKYILRSLARLDLHYTAVGLLGRRIMGKTLKQAVNYTTNYIENLEAAPALEIKAGNRQ